MSQSRIDLVPASARPVIAGVLPDVLAPGLAIVFCGTAPGAVSARRGAYYAGPGNAFWPTLFEVGLTPHALRPHEYDDVLRWRIGLTDLAKHVSGSDASLSPGHFDVDRLRGVIAVHRPALVAFTGKRAAAEFCGAPVDYGLLPDQVGSTRLFVLPSPSGAARRFWDLSHWRALRRWT